jgi:aminoglycoside phosphotransferase (APT) family kinase protein
VTPRQDASATEKLQSVGDQEPLDLSAVLRFMRENLTDPPQHLTAQRFGGGSSNLTYLLSDGEREWVLRRPPSGPLLPTAHDMAREYRVLSALATTDVPVARPLALCTDQSILGATFYLMERRRGFIVRDQVPPEVGDDVGRRRAVSFAVIDAMASLHGVDWRKVGLAEGFGKPEGYLARQLRRWHEQWERSKTQEVPALDQLETWLAARVPESLPATIVHGDFRLENCMIDAHSLRVVAIFDWEMSTLGDPLADLGWALAYWPEATDPPTWRQSMATVSTLPGFPTRAELIDRYESMSGRSVRAVRFYQVFALYKLAIIAQGIFRRVTGGQIQLAHAQAEQFGDRVAMIAQTGVEVAAS